MLHSPRGILIGVPNYTTPLKAYVLSFLHLIAIHRQLSSSTHLLTFPHLPTPFPKTAHGFHLVSTTNRINPLKKNGRYQPPVPDQGSWSEALQSWVCRKGSHSTHTWPFGFGINRLRCMFHDVFYMAPGSCFDYKIPGQRTVTMMFFEKLEVIPELSEIELMIVTRCC